MTAAEEEPEPSRTAGGCVLVVAAGVPVAVVFAAAPDAGVLTVWGLVVVACGWQYRRGLSDSSATPPPPSETPSGDVYADESVEVDRIERGPGEGLTIIYPVRTEVNGA
ncbi:hypothetical protein [Streptomyces sp. H27-S2]|uniref:hypothetical protein n=1 Tax=Streptomyces antarcticus TaxID=2996458 RepID=UPI002270114A|nr:hypothetical protein [Streptomyces sp. H27-S2]MCY0952102.1 hypothetical protein [Streptomyces sp. H27-S2]